MSKPYYKKLPHGRNQVPVKPRTGTRKPKSKFWAIHKDTGEKLEGILYDDGTCMLGPDAFRSLNKTDFPSYKTQNYRSLAEVKTQYDLKKPTYTAWYMEYRD